MACSVPGVEHVCDGVAPNMETRVYSFSSGWRR